MREKIGCAVGISTEIDSDESLVIWYDIESGSTTLLSPAHARWLAEQLIRAADEIDPPK